MNYGRGFLDAILLVKYYIKRAGVKSKEVEKIISDLKEKGEEMYLMRLREKMDLA